MTIEDAFNILDTVLQPACFNDTQASVFRQAWAGQTYEEIATELNFATDYIRAVGAQLWHVLSDAFGERITKQNFKVVIERWARQHRHDRALPSVTAHQDWGEAVDVSTFFGRAADLATLHQWIVVDRCRLVALLGMGGIGKTSLSVKLAQQVQHDFDALIWRSLRNAPPLSELLSHLRQFLRGGDEPTPSLSVDEQLSQLVQCLRDRRCLIILDNAEVILGSDHQTASSGYAGHYRAGYENYGDLFRLVGEVPHQSCVIITSREEPQEIDIQEGDTQPVRSFQLGGLSSVEGQAIFKVRGTFAASAADWQVLVQHYAGNPLALKMVASVIRDLFDGDIAKFLDPWNRQTLVFDDIRDLLHRQFERLSDDEKDVMYWLAINRELVSLADLQHDIPSPLAQQHLTEALRSLGRRFLIERSARGFTQQPVVMEYVVERFITQICQEIETADIRLLMSHALVKAQAPSYLRESQVRLILAPIADRLKTHFHSAPQVETAIQRVLAKLRSNFTLTPGYAAGNLLNLLHELAVDLTNYDFSRLTVWQANLQGVWLNGVNFTGSDLTRSVFTETLGSVWSIACSPDGKWLAAGDTLNTIHLWQLADRPKQVSPTKVLACSGHTNWVGCLAFSPDSQLFASGGGDTTVKLWNTTTGQCWRTLRGHTDWVLSVAFSADGQLLATSSADGTIKLWELATGRCLRTLSEHNNWVRGVAFVPPSADLKLDALTTHDRLLASGSADDTVKLWDVNTGICLRTIPLESEGAWAIALSPDGQTLVTGGANATVKQWDLASGHCLQTLCGHTHPVRSVAYSTTGRTIVSSSEDQTIRVWDRATGECRHVLHEHTSAVWSIACTQFDRLISGSLDQRVKLWDSRTGQCLATLQGYTDFVWATDIASQFASPLLASGSTDHTIKLWNMQTGQCLKTLQGHTNWVLSVAFNQRALHPGPAPTETIAVNRATLASSSFDHTIRLWDSHSGQCLHQLRGHTSWVLAVQFSPDGQTLVSSSFDQTVRLWDVLTGECLQTLIGHQGRLWSVAYSPDGRRLASGGDDLAVRLWDAQTGQCLQVLIGHSGRIRSVAFAPSTATTVSLLASSAEDHTIRLWDAETGECLRVLRGHTKHVQSIVFSADGRWLASGSEDQQVRLWNPYTGECLQTFIGHTNRVWSVAFGWLPTTSDRPDAVAPHHRLIVASGSEDETIRLWDAETGECLRVLRGPKPYHAMNITGVKGLTAAQTATLKALGAVENSHHLS